MISITPLTIVALQIVAAVAVYAAVWLALQAWWRFVRR
jgi:hypothetical protein